MKCPSCDNEIPQDNVHFCPYCGIKLETEETEIDVSCYNCKKTVDSRMGYCPHCGVKLMDYTWNTDFRRLSNKELESLLKNVSSEFWGPERTNFMINLFISENMKSIFQFLNFVMYFGLNEEILNNEIHYLCPMDDESVKEVLNNYNGSIEDKINVLVKFKGKEISRRELFNELNIEEYFYPYEYNVSNVKYDSSNQTEESSQLIVSDNEKYDLATPFKNKFYHDDLERIKNKKHSLMSQILDVKEPIVWKYLGRDDGFTDSVHNDMQNSLRKERSSLPRYVSVDQLESWFSDIIDKKYSKVSIEDKINNITMKYKVFSKKSIALSDEEEYNVNMDAIKSKLFDEKELFDSNYAVEARYNYHVKSIRNEVIRDEEYIDGLYLTNDFKNNFKNKFECHIFTEDYVEKISYGYVLNPQHQKYYVEFKENSFSFKSLDYKNPLFVEIKYEDILLSNVGENYLRICTREFPNLVIVPNKDMKTNYLQIALLTRFLESKNICLNRVIF